MANHRKKPTANRHKGCNLCDYHKQIGNAQLATKPKYREVKWVV